jgi:hypothetical protein
MKLCIGLGGTSLINANVFMEADKETLQMKAWPPEIRENPSELDRCKSILPGREDEDG